MANEKLKHVGAAYLILAVVLWSLWSVLLAPAAALWGDHKMVTTELQREIDMLAARGDESRRSTSNLGMHISNLVSQHVVGGPATATVAGHQLLTGVKQALQTASATVAEIRPRSAPGSKWLNQSQLDVSFRIPAAKLETLLDALAQHSPLLHIQLMSLREPTLGVAGAPQLEARLIVNAWNASEALSALFGELAPPLAESSATSSSTSSMPELAGLFDAVYRAKLHNPSTEHYRLSAVTLGASARIAIVADLQSGTTRRLREGDMLDGWRIKSIDSDGVQLESGKRTAKLTLQQK